MTLPFLNFGIARPTEPWLLLPLHHVGTRTAPSRLARRHVFYPRQAVLQVRVSSDKRIPMTFRIKNQRNQTDEPKRAAEW